MKEGSEKRLRTVEDYDNGDLAADYERGNVIVMTGPGATTQVIVGPTPVTKTQTQFVQQRLGYPIMMPLNLPGYALSRRAISSTPNPSTYGEWVTITIAVASASGIPTGSVSLSDGSTTIGTCSLDAAGTCTVVSRQIQAGVRSLVARYAGDGTFLPSASATGTQQVLVTATSTSISTSLNPSEYGQRVDFTVRVDATTGVPTGTVTITDGTLGVVVGTCSLTTGGSCVVTRTSIAAGTHALTAPHKKNNRFIQRPAEFFAKCSFSAKRTAILISDRQTNHTHFLRRHLVADGALTRSLGRNKDQVGTFSRLE